MSIRSNAVTSNIIKQWNIELLFKILNNILDAVLVIDSNTTIVYVNDAYARIFGVDVTDVLGQRLDSLRAEPAKIINVLATGNACQGHDFVKEYNVHVVGNSFPLFDGNEVIGAVSIFKNITKEVELKSELQRTKGLADYLKEQLEQWEQLPYSFKEYVGLNRHLKQTLVLAAKVAPTDSTVLILGESGVGKEVLARAIHNSSRRKDMPMIKVNCAAIPENLIESELFGYGDGAFTGAKKGGKPGKFELAHTGTIFLDEIGDMSLSMQAKLLRVLQEKEFERVGGTKTIKVDFRVIAATNRDLESMIETGEFRRDLYYRLNIVALDLPPLRERKDDLMTLSKTFLEQFSREVGHKLTLSPEVVSIFQDYNWPGNIRELQNVLEHASIACSGMLIEPHHLPSRFISSCESQSNKKDGPRDVKEYVGTVEKDLILSTLADNNNNRTKNMKELGISRRAFYNKLHKYGIEK